MSNNCSITTDLTATNTLITTVNTVVDLIRSTDVPAIAALIDPLQLYLDKKAVSHIVGADATTALYVTVVDISDKGILTGISQYGNRHEPVNDIRGSIKITIDGDVKYDGEFCYDDMRVDMCYGGGGSISLDIPFETSLKVEHKAAIANCGCRTLVGYTVDA